MSLDERVEKILAEAELACWDAPVPLPAYRNTVRFCQAILGDPVAAFVQAVAVETATPVDLPALAALGTVSAIIAGSVVVEPHYGWQEPVNLYLNVLAAPGEGKTPSMRKVVRPIDAVEQDRRERAEPLRADIASRSRIAQARAKRLEELAAKANPSERDDAIEDALAAGRDLASIVIPAIPRIYTREATPEALVKLLAEQNGRLAVVTDEGSEFYEMAARYSGNGKGNLGVYVDGWDGKRHVSDRAGRDPIVVERATLTVCLFGQPIVLNDVGSDPQMSGRGLLARFLWSLPASRVGYRPIHREPVSEALTASWSALVTDLAAQAEEIVEPIVLRLSPAAKHLWDEWREHHEPRLRRDVGDLASIVEWGSKLPGQSLRLAGNLHALHTGHLGGVISEETMASALKLAVYFTDHALVAFARMGADKRLEDANLVLRWVEGREFREFTTRDVCRSKDWEVDRVRVALDVLADYNLVRLLPHEQGNGRPAERWERNPQTTRQNPTKVTEEEVLSGFVRQNGQIQIQNEALIDTEAYLAICDRLETMPDNSSVFAELEALDLLARTELTVSEAGTISRLIDESEDTNAQ
ncbi:MAG TPA: YfjI family protein [Acidimicrobiales bacterium]|nr:YfjI family protein [Acidimicrobiales bacterium]